MIKNQQVIINKKISSSDTDGNSPYHRAAGARNFYFDR